MNWKTDTDKCPMIIPAARRMSSLPKGANECRIPPVPHSGCIRAILSGGIGRKNFTFQLALSAWLILYVFKYLYKRR